MATDFPISPVEGDTYVIGSVTWEWNGSDWIVSENPNGALTSNQIAFAPSSSNNISISEESPSNPQYGDRWFDVTKSAMYVYYDGFWVEVSSST